MKLTINPLEFSHIKEASVYNNNVYKHNSGRYFITETCHEDFNFNEYFLSEIKDVEGIFIGCCYSENSLDNDEKFEIDFREYYT